MNTMDRINKKNDTYEELADSANRAENKVKISAKAKGQLSEGFSTIQMPKQPTKSLISDGPTGNFGPSWKPKGRK